jgi:nitroimidazol reductase NimA-like FMN-containing flavoprotein (pyridoxamine 5'-phosphate oxidase superfamily)
VDATTIDASGLEVLGRDECLRLLGTASIGRVGLHWDALPTVLPVNFVLDGDRVVFRTGRGTKLAAASAGSVVAFEVDEVDAWYHDGWSVVVTGKASTVTDPDDVARLQLLPLRSWAPNRGDALVSIEPTLVSGRRLTHRRISI